MLSPSPQKSTPGKCEAGACNKCESTCNLSVELVNKVVLRRYPEQCNTNRVVVRRYTEYCDTHMNIYGRARLLDALSMAANLRLFSTSAARSWRVKSGWTQPGLQLIPGVLDSLQDD